jgi:hypothetical protein
MFFSREYLIHGGVLFLYYTVAMVTLADYRMFTKQQLSECREFVKLQGLGNQEVMGKLIKNVEIKIGQLTILWDVCATKLTDTVLLGLDIFISC